MAGPLSPNKTVPTRPTGTSDNSAASTQFVSSAITAKTRERLTAARTYYVNTGGSNSNDGLTSGNPFQTIQHAWDVIQNTLDLAGQNVTIQCANQTFSTALVAGIGFFDSYANQSGAGSVTLDLGGGTLSPSGGFLNTDCITVAGPIKLTVQSGTLMSSSGNCLSSQFEATITIGPNLTFGAAASGYHMAAQYAGIIRGISDYAISGGAVAHMYGDARGFIILLFPTVTITGPPAFSQAFAVAQSQGSIHLGSVTYNGSATGKRFAIVGAGGQINFENSANTTYFPGDAAGTYVAGSQYDSAFPVGGAGVAISSAATDGFWYIPTCAGTATGTPSTITGCVPMVYDTSNNKFWIYNGAWRGIVLA